MKELVNDLDYNKNDNSKIKIKWTTHKNAIISDPDEDVSEPDDISNNKDIKKT
jgi:hypothetical protein